MSEPNPHFTAVQAAQAKRLSAQSVTQIDLDRIFDQMPAQIAFDLAHMQMARAMRRRQEEAWNRPVDGAS